MKLLYVLEPNKVYNCTKCGTQLINHSQNIYENTSLVDTDIYCYDCLIRLAFETFPENTRGVWNPTHPDTQEEGYFDHPESELPKRHERVVCIDTPDEATIDCELCGSCIYGEGVFCSVVITDEFYACIQCAQLKGIMSSKI